MTPIEVHNNHVFVPVVSRGKRLWFLLDSGAAAPLNIMDAGRAKELGIKAEGSGTASAIGGRAKIAFTDPVSVSIGGYGLPKAKLALMDLAGGAKEEGHAVDGLLGYSVFKQFAVQIDYPARKLRLYDRSQKDFGRQAAAVPLTVEGKNCVITAQLTLRRGTNPVPVRVVVDTGYDETLILTSPFVRKNNIAVQPKNKGTGLGGSISSGDLTLSFLRLGNVTVRNLRARASMDKEGAFSSTDVDGYIGGGVLKKYIATFDYAHGRLLLAHRMR